MKRGVSVLLFLFVSFYGFGQGIHIPIYRDTLRPVYNHRLETFPQPVSNFVSSIHAIPIDFYAQHLPFFCRQELKMKDAHVPVSFRLGTVEQCDYLEQKAEQKER